MTDTPKVLALSLAEAHLIDDALHLEGVPVHVHTTGSAMASCHTLQARVRSIIRQYEIEGGKDVHQSGTSAPWCDACQSYHSAVAPGCFAKRSC